ncbi:MAG: protease pro-enzyme activation domain-containing protein [Aliidongia sp.]
MLASRIALGTALAASLGMGGIACAKDVQSEVAVGATVATKNVPFSVYLPLTHTAELEQFLRDVVNPSKSTYHQWLSPAQFKAAYGPSADSVAQVKAALAAAGMTVSAEHTRSLEVEGSAAAVQAMFAMPSPDGAPMFRPAMSAISRSKAMRQRLLSSRRSARMSSASNRMSTTASIRAS